MTKRLNYVTRNMTPEELYNFLEWLMKHDRDWVVEWLEKDIHTEDDD